MSAARAVNLSADTKLDHLCVNTIRTLSIDAVQQAKSGHPGTPMALAPLVYTIWNRVLRFDPENPIWPNRDRFALSNGHASMLLWSALHLSRTRAVNADYETLGRPSVALDDNRRFRQLDSKAPGHPEYHWTSGVEATTCPLGQGVAMSVGMAIAEKWLARRFNRPGFEIFDTLTDGKRTLAAPSDCFDRHHKSQRAETLSEWLRSALNIRAGNEEFHRGLARSLLETGQPSPKDRMKNREEMNYR